MQRCARRPQRGKRVGPASSVAPEAVVEGTRAQGRRNKATKASHLCGHGGAVRAFWVGLLGWGGEKGRPPTNSTLVREADSAARTNVEISANSSPEFHLLDEFWRNSE